MSVVARGGQRHWEFMELQLQVVVNSLMWVC